VSPLGEILVAGSLDRETRDQYSLTIVANNTGASPPLWSFTSVSITITDVNDNAPKFDFLSYTFHIKESAAVGTLLGQVSATDRDLEITSDFVFFFKSLVSFPFQVNETTGEITLTESLDFEKVPEYTNTMIVRDMGIPSLRGTSAITIKVLNVNDNAPHFSQYEYVVNVKEDAAIGTVVLSVNAIDYDGDSSSGGGGIAYYALETDMFSINAATGDITVFKTLDRETTSAYTFIVYAQDFGVPRLSSQNVSVTVNVLDVNDNAPAFASNYTIDLLENQSGDIYLTTILATDPDSGLAGQAGVRYSLTPNEFTAMFKLDAMSGVLTAITPFDFEMTHSVALTALATDSGTPPLHQATAIVINILDQNDNSPVFSNSSYEVEVLESAGR
jgi:hypothetical protein